MSTGERVRLLMAGHARRDAGGAEILEVSIGVPADLRWFRGHFEGNPVLPAVVQLLEALRLTTATWPDLAGLRRITRAKFRAPIRPSDDLRLGLTRARGAGKVAFEYRRGPEVCSSGTLEFGPARGGDP